MQVITIPNPFFHVFGTPIYYSKENIYSNILKRSIFPTYTLLLFEGRQTRPSWKPNLVSGKSNEFVEKLLYAGVKFFRKVKENRKLMLFISSPGYSLHPKAI